MSSPFTGPVFARAHLDGVTWHREHDREPVAEGISVADARRDLGGVGFFEARQKARRASRTPEPLEGAGVAASIRCAYFRRKRERPERDR